MATSKPNFNRIWAAGAPVGNVVDPDVSSPGKFDDGWLAEVPTFQNFNFLQQLFTQGLAYINEQGIGDWDIDTAYPIKGITKGSDGNLYESVLEQDGNDPISDDGTNWKLWFSFKAINSTEPNYSKRLWNNRLNVSPTVPTVVITGDSLSYNHQDFDAVARQNAEDCFPGMNSWSFVIRDAIIRSSGFVHADEIQYLMSTGVSKLGQIGSAQFINPFNGRLNVFRATAQTDSLKFYYKHSGPQNKAYMWFLKNPLDTGCSFEVKVNGASQVPVWNTGGTTISDPYQGYELHLLEIPNVPNSGIWSTIELTDFIGTASVPDPTNRDVYFMGIGSNAVNIKQTGRGGQSSQWIVDNLAEKVTDFTPDLTIITIGANDPWAGNPQGLQTVSDYIDNLNTIFDGIEAANSNARILLISPPLTNESIILNSTMIKYIKAAREVAYKRGTGFIDVNELFSNAPTELYRFDSIHYSKQGNSMLANRVADIIGLELSDELDCVLSYGQYPFSEPDPVKERIFSAYDGANFSRVVLRADPSLDVVASITKENDYSIRVTINIDPQLYGNISIKQFDANGAQKITASPQNYFNGFVLFQLRKQDGSQLIAADWVTYLSSLKFIVEFT